MSVLRLTWHPFAFTLRTTLGSPAWLAMGVFQPAVWLVLSAPLLDSLGSAPGALTVSIPAVATPAFLLLLAVCGSVFAGFGMFSEIHDRVPKHLSVCPARRPAVALGRGLGDLVVLTVQVAILLALALVIDVRLNAMGVLLVFGSALVIGLVLASCSFALALMLKNEHGPVAALGFFALPLVLLCCVMLSLALAAGWMLAVAGRVWADHLFDAVGVLLAFEINDAAALLGGVVAALGLFAVVWAARSSGRVAV